MPRPALGELDTAGDPEQSFHKQLLERRPEGVKDEL